MAYILLDISKGANMCCEHALLLLYEPVLGLKFHLNQSVKTRSDD